MQQRRGVTSARRPRRAAPAGAAQVEDMQSEGDMAIIHCKAPVAAMFGFASELPQKFASPPRPQARRDRRHGRPQADVRTRAAVRVQHPLGRAGPRPVVHGARRLRRRPQPSATRRAPQRTAQVEPVPRELLDNTTREIRKRKGMKEEPYGAEYYAG